MKAVVCTGHGSPEVLQLQDVYKPIPSANEILIKIVATTVTSGDTILRKQSFFQYLLLWTIARLFFGIKNQRKKILGHEFSGEIETVGKNVKPFKNGNKVFGTTGFAGGAYAEYICLPQKSVICLIPENLSFKEAAAVPIGAVCALNLLQKGNIEKVKKILIYGASGSIGTYAVQLARYYGTEITAVCSTGNFELVKSLGATFVIDYTKEDYTKRDSKYDIVFDTVGKISYSKSKKVLNKNGKFISSHSTPIKEKQKDLIFIKELIESGNLKPVVDKYYSLAKISDAHHYVDAGHKKGNVVITVINDT